MSFYMHVPILTESIPFIDKWSPFTCLASECCIPLTALNALSINYDHKTRKFSQLFHSRKILLPAMQVPVIENIIDNIVSIT